MPQSIEVTGQHLFPLPSSPKVKVRRPARAGGLGGTTMTGRGPGHSQRPRTRPPGTATAGDRSGRAPWAGGGSRGPIAPAPGPPTLRGPSGDSKGILHIPSPGHEPTPACGSELGGAGPLHPDPGRKATAPPRGHTPETPAAAAARSPGTRARAGLERGPGATPEERAWGGRVYTAKLQLPPRPHPRSRAAAPAYLHARQARLHRGVGHGAPDGHFLARDGRAAAIRAGNQGRAQPSGGSARPPHPGGSRPAGVSTEARGPRLHAPHPGGRAARAAGPPRELPLPPLRCAGLGWAGLGWAAPRWSRAAWARSCWPPGAGVGAHSRPSPRAPRAPPRPGPRARPRGPAGDPAPRFREGEGRGGGRRLPGRPRPQPLRRRLPCGRVPAPPAALRGGGLGGGGGRDRVGTRLGRVPTGPASRHRHQLLS
jgi:hypothetical protein